ncbi:MAG: glycine cleavage system aminomethyltransferase GcvT [Desulfovibrio sp.]|jgi:aminomethyltransferase|nr:glycine cleavage system aminomethyltransferase GcvT [Desulfovibrio sp.]
MADLLTPLAQWHKDHGAKMAPFAGWLMPIQYEGILAEHKHTRTKASVFDICHMGEFLMTGRGAAGAVALALTHNIATLAPGRCRYGFLLNEAGGVMDDCILYRMGDEEFMLVVNAACREKDVAALRKRLTAAVALDDVSDATAKIDLQGPLALDVLEDVLKGTFRLPYFGFVQQTFKGEPLLVSRTGYTGELGFELYVPTRLATELWTLLLSHEDVKPAGLGARDTLRLEAGLALYGHELDEEHSPEESGMSQFLTSSAPFVGRAPSFPIRERLVPLRIEGRKATRNGDKVTLPDGTPAGRVTSGSFAPSLGCVVAFAYIAAPLAGEPEFRIPAGKEPLVAKPTTIPFYTEGTARKKLA